MILSPRPTKRDKAIAQSVATSVSKDFMALGGISVPALVRAFEYADEYDQACCLAKLGFDVDMSVVEALVNLRPLWIEHHTNAVVAWVMENGVRFPAKVGQNIRFMTPGHKLNCNGCVDSIVFGEARAIVAVGDEKKMDYLSAAAEDVIQILTGLDAPMPIKADPVRNTVGFQLLIAANA